MKSLLGKCLGHYCFFYIYFLSGNEVINPFPCLESIFLFVKLFCGNKKIIPLHSLFGIKESQLNGKTYRQE